MPAFSSKAFGTFLVLTTLRKYLYSFSLIKSLALSAWITSWSIILFNLCCISASVALPSGLTLFKDKKIMSDCLSYSPSMPLFLTSLGSYTISLSTACLNVLADSNSSLTITPVSLRPLSLRILLASWANLFFLPCSIASA